MSETNFYVSKLIGKFSEEREFLGFTLQYIGYPDCDESKDDKSKHSMYKGKKKTENSNPSKYRS